MKRVEIPKANGKYYERFGKSAMSAIHSYINDKLLNWVRREFKPLKRRKWLAGQWLRGLTDTIRPYLHIGAFGVGWLNSKSRMNLEIHVRFREQLKGAVPFG
ncbi:hypothetical protein [Methylomicrobium sp. Wu6]|uniref:hypothetical protein n=1 Tax=Methylomicrobium sp. Wu6 TaxID=3107928 RepID=UPI002DD67511|nr:hypothetical protein [Methylomicrobium sp. Wu6]MEC4747992.1 hypothetical protein [Methylomicrobium sp. Wu6]